MELAVISHLNNQGVDLLRRGELRSAADTLRIAQDLALTRLIPDPTAADISAKETMDQVTALLTAAAGDSFVLLVGLPRLYPDALEIASSFPLSKTFRNDAVFLQTQGIYLTLNSYQEPRDIKFTIEVIVNSILLYNLGLVSQLHSIYGMGIGVSDAARIACDSFKFRRHHANLSRSLYMRSRLILEFAGIATQQATGIPLLDLLSMALDNNAAYAAYVDGDYETCRNFFQELALFRESLLTMPAYRHWNHETIAIVNEYISEFFMNAVALKESNVAPAA